MSETTQPTGVSKGKQKAEPGLDDVPPARNPDEISDSSHPAQSPPSPPGSPLKPHESIWKRSKKILGMSRYTFLQQIDAKDSNDKTAKSPNSGEENGGASKPAVSKRREQVRRAQKTHRQRTENYIKALEQEVLRLQKEESDRAAERAAERAERERQKELEIQNAELNTGVAVDVQAKQQQHSDAYVRALELQIAELQREKAQAFQAQMEQGQQDVGRAGFGAASATVTLLDGGQGCWKLKAAVPDYPMGGMGPNVIAPPMLGNDGWAAEQQALAQDGVGQATQGLQLLHQRQQRYGSDWQRLLAVNPLANHQTAIDFVLSLEEECMPHIHQSAHTSTISPHSPTGTPSDPGINGHTFTAAGQLLELAPFPIPAQPSSHTTDASPESNPSNVIDNENPPMWTTSNAEIERLFELAGKLGLEGELTPVQAWLRIWERPGAERLSRERLGWMEGELKGLVACYGFGGAIDEGKFERVVEKGFEDL